MKTLILAEHHGNTLNASIYRAVTAAQSWNNPIDVLVTGNNVHNIAQQVALIDGVSRVVQIDAEHLAHQLPEDVAPLIANIANEYSVVLAAHSSFSRNILARAAALLDVAMISDVLEIKDNNTYVRAIYAGNILTTVQSADRMQLLTVHSSRFSLAQTRAQSAEISAMAAPASQHQTRWLSETRTLSDRPALSTAKTVISGGRSLGSAETFEQMLSPLAAKLDAAVGATRAAVDAGYAPNDIQVGQTGVTVAPDLYIAVGISGAVQHTYGMKDSKIVVAINQDPDAPIFQVADYGLVADLFEAIPELTAAI